MAGGDPLLTDTGNGLTILYRGRRLYSPAEPRPSAQRRARSQALRDHTLYVLPSPLFFYGVPELLGRLPPSCHLLCVEIDQELMALSLRNVDEALLRDPRLTYVRTESAEAIALTVRGFDLGRFRRCEEIRLSAGHSLYPEAYRLLLEAAEGEIHAHWRNRMTLIHLSSLWIRNVFLNLPRVPEASDLSELRTSLPIVVAGAGESLEGAISKIEQARSSLYLLAADTAIPVLADFGLAPDGVVVLEAQASNLDDFIGFRGGQVDVLADLSSYPRALQRFPGPRFLFFSDFGRVPLFDRIEAAGLLPTRIAPLGSVGVAAVSCALRMTAGPVFLAGLDFSFRPGKTHARGSPPHRLALRSWDRLKPPAVYRREEGRAGTTALDKEGASVATNPALLSYLTALRQLVRGESRVFDLRSGGLPLGLPSVESAAAFSALLGGRADPGGSKSGPIRPEIGDVAGFLRDEDRRIARMIRLAEASLGGEPADGLSEALGEVGYLYLHFPDRPAFPSVEAGFLRRCVESADSCRRWIAQALRSTA